MRTYSNNKDAEYGVSVNRSSGSGYQTESSSGSGSYDGLAFHNSSSSHSSSTSLFKKTAMVVCGLVAISVAVVHLGGGRGAYSTTRPTAFDEEYTSTSSMDVVYTDHSLTTGPGPQVEPVGAKSASFDDLGRYIIHNFDSVKPFASFLPGLAGKYGTPMWGFYVNRGQAMAAFGIENKEHPLLEFEPANLAYQQIPRTGFRTFVKGTRGEQSFTYEPFRVGTRGVERSMFIDMNEFEIEEVNTKAGLQTNVLYYTVHEEDFPGLVRRTTLKNIGTEAMEFEAVDGLARMQCYGVFDFYLKSMDRTIEAWMNAFNMDDDGHGVLPFFKLSASIVDSEVVTMIIPGNYALGYVEKERSGDGNHVLLPIIVDPTMIFGQDTTFSFPTNLEAHSISEILTWEHTTTGRTPCAFVATPVMTLQPGESVTVTSIYGRALTLNELTDVIAPTVTEIGFLSAKRSEAQRLIQSLTKPAVTRTGNDLFNGYVQYNFMDNMLRGGYPYLLGDAQDPKIYHTFSRIHGDLERDYNYFVISPEYYSQGPGNYRDVNQNRRNDVSWQPKVGDFNIQTFMSLLQADGYNPMSVQSVMFNITDTDTVHDIASKMVPEQYVDDLAAILEPPFRPGQLFSAMKAKDLISKLVVTRETFLKRVTAAAIQIPQADFSQGFWSDHWTYTLDLFNDYLRIWPDNLEWVLWESDPVPTYLSPNKVVPRHEKYVLVDEKTGKVRQLGMNIPDPDRVRLLAMNRGDPNGIWMCLKGTQVGGTDAAGSNPFSTLAPPNGKGRCKVHYQPVVSKFTLLVVVKFALLDPLGMGVEMEGGKPGWLDALNGLPALFGSSMPEACELHRYLVFLRDSVSTVGRDVVVVEELNTLMEALEAALDQFDSDGDAFAYWDSTAHAREAYRDEVAMTFTGKHVTWSAKKMVALLDRMINKVYSGIDNATEYNGGYPPSYFSWEVTEYDLTGTEDVQLRPYVYARGMAPTVLPLFLEGPVRNMKVLKTVEEKRTLFQATKAGTLYDQNIAMYKISEDLSTASFEIGRVQGFSPGWLENESVWLHMSYKWYLELLRGQLFDEFWVEATTGLVVFMNPEIYGRSPLECSSFLASSRYMDKSLWAAGFVSRLSGSTAEFMTMYNLMMAGPNPFTLDEDGDLQLSFAPALPAWLFTTQGTLSFTLLGHTTVTYHNPFGRNTWEDGMKIVRITLDDDEVNGSIITGEAALMVRNQEVEEIDVFFHSSN